MKKCKSLRDGFDPWLVGRLEQALNSCSGEWVVIDFLYNCDVVYDGDSLDDARIAKLGRIADTYGECFCKIMRRAD